MIVRIANIVKESIVGITEETVWPPVKRVYLKISSFYFSATKIKVMGILKRTVFRSLIKTVLLSTQNMFKLMDKNFCLILIYILCWTYNKRA